MDFTQEALDTILADLDGELTRSLDDNKAFCEQFEASLAPSDESIRSQLHYIQARMHLMNGRVDAALERFEAAIELSQRNGDLRLEAQSRKYAGMCYEYAAMQLDSTRELMRSLDIAEQLGDKQLLGEVYYALSALCDVQEAFDQCRQNGLKALQLAQEAGDSRIECLARGGIGYSLGRLDRLDEGIDWIEGGLARCEELGLKRVAMFLHGYLIMLYRKAGRFEDGLAKVNIMLASIHSMPIQHAAAACVHAAEIRADLGDFEGASVMLDRITDMTAGTKLQGHSLHFYGVSARVYEELGDYARALEMMKEFAAATERQRGRAAEARLVTMERRHTRERMSQEATLNEHWTTELMAANAKLSALNSEKDEILQIVAHDLKNPLAAISITSASLLENNKLPALVDRQIAHVAEISDDMKATVNGLLQSEVEASGPAIELGEVVVVELIESCVEPLRLVAAQKDIALDVFSADHSLCAAADSAQLRRVVENLVSNAIKYSPPRTTVRISVCGNSTRVLLIVRDEGPGFTQEEHARVFTKYGNLSAQPTAGESSTGLGLYIAKKLVENMFGTISLTSNAPSHGSTFTVALDGWSTYAHARSDLSRSS